MALKDDNINLYVNVNTTPAQENILKLKDVNRELSDSNREARKEMEQLAKQGEKESDAYKQLSASIKENNATIKENNASIKELEKELSVTEMTMGQLKKRAKELRAQLDHVVPDSDKYRELSKSLGEVEGRMLQVKNSGKSLSGQLQSIPGPAGAVAKSVTGINTAFKILLANPIFAILAAIVIVFMALAKAIKSSEEATNKFNQIMAPLEALMDGLLFIVQKLVGAILDFISAIINGLMKALEKLPFVGKYFKELNDIATEAIKLEKEKQELAKRERAAIEENAKRDRDISELRNKAKQKDIYSEKERIAFLEEAIKLEREKADESLAIAQERLRIAELEAARAENTAEQEKELAQLRADVFNAEREYYDRTRRLQTELTTFRREEEARRKEEAKKALDARLKMVDDEINTTRRKLMQQRIDRKIDDKELNTELEKLELESLQRKLKIHGLSKEQRLEIEKQILDARLKIQQEEEKTVNDLSEKIRVGKLSALEKELDDIRIRYDKEAAARKKAYEMGILSESEYLDELARLRDEKQAEIDRKAATNELARLQKKHEEEKLLIMEQYADSQLSYEEYQEEMLTLEARLLEEKLRINGLAEEQITKLKQQQLNKQIANQEAALKKQEARQKKYTQMFMNFAGQMGESLGEALTNSEAAFSEVMGDILLTALDALRQVTTLAITETTIRNISKYGSFIGLPKAAAEIALINVAFAAVKNIIKRPNKKTAKSDTAGSEAKSGRYTVNQYAGGKYDVVGAADGQTYRDVPYIGSPESGIYNRPALFAEQGSELIVSAPDLKLLKQHVVYPHFVSALSGIRGGRVKQYAEGSYDSIDTGSETTPPESSEQIELLRGVMGLLDDLQKNGVHSNIGITEFEARQQFRDESKIVGTF